jgi:hypothetical protein
MIELDSLYLWIFLLSESIKIREYLYNFANFCYG